MPPTIGAIRDTYDIRTYQFAPRGAFDWEKGFDIEKVIGRDLVTKDQGGSYSCFNGNTGVLMEDFSYLPISKITVGDYVLTHKGEPRRVSKTYKKKWQGNYHVVSLYGDYKEIECTKEHPFYAIKRNHEKKWSSDSKGKTTWIPVNGQSGEPGFYDIKDLKKGDWVAFPFNSYTKDVTINSYESDPEFLWLLGLYMAEGCTNKYGVVFSLNTDEMDWLPKITRIMAKYGANVTHFVKSKNSLTINIFGAKWSRVFSELGGNLCDKKRLPNRLMLLTPALQMNIVRGIQDGDGHYRRNTVTIKSTSKIMLEQSRTILLRNGIYSSLCKEKPYTGKKQAYTLEYNLKNLSRYSFTKGDYVFVQIKSNIIKSAYSSGNVYNLEVEDHNSYQVNGIAVHNCGGQAWAYYGEVLETIATGDYEPRSARWIYAPVRVGEGGSMGKELSAYVRKNGFALEEHAVSYDRGRAPGESFMSNVPVLSDTALEIAEVSKPLSYVQVSNTIDTIAEAIAKNNGCCIAFYGEDNGTWRSEFPKPPVNRAWAHWTYAGKVKMMNGKKYIGIKNSWGDKTGRNGWQWLGEDYFKNGNVWYGWTLAWDYKPAQHKTLLIALVKLLQQYVGLLTKK